MHVVNETISHYRIVKKLGAGGMGEVYLAEDMRLERTVALKILPSEFTNDSDRMRRFEREAKAASAVKHDRVAHIYEIGEANGVHFISMEYVEGESLAARIAREPVKISTAIDFGIEIADALTEAQRKGITHRDIKPANIMVTGTGHVKLLDFGLARIVDAPKEGTDLPTESQTQIGLAIGTLPYMSPEQLLGRAVDHRTDIFSLGVVLYQLVTKRLPFSGNTSAELVDQLLHSEPQLPSQLNDRVPAELDRIIRKCLEKDPDRRYSSCADLRNDLERLKLDITGSGSIAAPATARRIGKASGIAAAVVIAISIIGFFIYRSMSHHDPIDSLAVLPFSNPNNDRDLDYLADGLTETLINNLSQINGLKVMSRSSVFRYKGQEPDPEALGRELKVRAVLTGRIVSHNGDLNISMELVDTSDNRHVWGEQYTRKESDALALQQDISDDVLKNLKVKFTEPEHQQVVKKYTVNPEAYQLYLRGRFEWYQNSEASLNQATNYFKEAIQADPDYALAYVGLADTYNALGFNYILPADEIFPKAKQAALKALELDPALAEAHIALGVYKLFYEWDWPGAEKEAQLAKSLSPRYSKSIELQTTNSSHFYCYYLDVLGHPEEAVAEQKKALLMDPYSFFFYAEMGWSYYVARKYDDSINQAKKALQMDPSQVLAYLALGNDYREKRNYAEAIAQLKKAYALAQDPATVAEVAYGFAAGGMKDEAIKLLDDLKRRSATERIDPGNIGMIYIALGDKDQAFEWLQKAYDVHSQWMTWIKVEPKYDPIRSDPRFAVLQRKVGLPS